MDDETVPVPPAEAITILERFLDPHRSEGERGETLNDPRVPDHIIAAFIRTLADEQLLEALLRCQRPGVLALWVIDPDARARHRVALNWSASIDTLRVLASDDDALVRTCVALNPSTDLDIRAWLLADPCPDVRECVLEIEEACSIWPDDEDGGPGEDDMLAFLHGFVPAAEELDCLEALDRERRLAEAAVIEYELRRIGASGELDDPVAGCEDDTDGKGEESPWRITEVQALALLRYYLGAVDITPPVDDTDERQ